MKRLVTCKGALVASGIPLAWLMHFYGLAVHLRLALGRWPRHISDNPNYWLFESHSATAWLIWGLMWLSLFAVPVVALTLLAWPRTRRLAVYPLIYAAAVGLTWPLMHLAPDSFIYWWWD